MNKLKLLLVAILSVTIITVVINKKDNSTADLRKNHENFIDNHPYQQTLKLSKKQRKNQSLPPNKYLEQEYLLEINPLTGKNETEDLLKLQEELNQNNRAVPGEDLNPWVERGPNNVPGRTRAIMFDPNDATKVFAGGVSGGLWVNNNIEANTAWERVGISENLAVSSIAVDKMDPQIMYVGTGETYTNGNINGNGIWQSTDGGATWNHIFGGSTGATYFNGDATLEVTTPASIAGVYAAVVAGFGPTTTPTLNANLVLVDDGTAKPTEGCNALINAAAIAGNIAVIDRGSCFFVDKVTNAETAGAVAVIVINNLATSPFAMGTSGNPNINIPSVMISKSDGDILKNAMLIDTVTVTYDFDNDNDPGGVIVPGIFHINDIIARENNAISEIYAAVGDTGYRDAFGTFIGTEGGLYKSTDDGVTWNKINLPLTADGNPYTPNDLMLGPDNKIWLASTESVGYQDGGGAVFSSADGDNFELKYTAPGGQRVQMASSATDVDKIYLLIQTATVQIKLTEDGFATTPTNLSLPNDADPGIPANDFTRGQAFYDLTIAVDPNDDAKVYVGGVDTFKSTNSGSSWSQMSKWAPWVPGSFPYVHADIHNIIFHPTDSNKGLIATDGGVFYATSFTNNSIVTRGLDYNTTQFYKGAISQDTSNDKILGGAQDNGSSLMNTSNQFPVGATEIWGGDGMLCFIDKDGQYMVASNPNNTFHRFSGSGNYTNTIISQNNGTFVNAATLDDNLDILYTNATASTNYRITRIKNLNSPQITVLQNNMFSRPPTTLKVSPFTTNSTKLFVGTDSGNLFKVTNANTNASWASIGSPDFAGSISAIEFGTNENEIMVTFHNFGIVSIWFTEDGGTTWQNKEGDFPDIPVKCIMMNPALSNEVIIGTNLGVWRTANFNDANPNWVQSQSGMQNVKVTSFSLRTADNLVLASTYGRGFYTGSFSQWGASTNSNELTNALSIYPTVSNGNFTIKSETVNNTNMEVFDMNGRVVYKEQLTINNQTAISLNLEKGIYLVNFNNNNIKESHKIIIK